MKKKQITKKQIENWVKERFKKMPGGMYEGGTVECIWDFLNEFGFNQIPTVEN